MLNEKKGIGIGIILKLVLGFMVLGLIISVSTVGSLGEAIFDSTNKIINKTDKTVEIEDERTFSHLAVYTRDKALNHGCEIIELINEGEAERMPGTGDSVSVIQHYYRSGEEEGYPALSNTIIKKKPDCYGGKSGLIREGGGIIDPKDPDERYMPGLYSRQKFEIKEDLNFDVGTGELWIEKNFGSAYSYSPTRHTSLIKEYEKTEDKQGFLGGLIEGAKKIGAAVAERAIEVAPIKASQIEGSTVATEAVDVQLYFTTGKIGEGDLSERTSGLDFPNSDNPDDFEDTDLEGEITLCKGDKGFVQGSRGYPGNDGQSNDEPLYPIIVIEEIEETSC